MCVLMKIWFGFKSWSSERSTITLSCWNICLVSITWCISWSFTWVSATRYTLLFHLLFVIFTFLFTKMDIQLKMKRKFKEKWKKKWDKTMTAVCRHWGWKLFTPNIWQVGNNNKIRWQNSRAVYNQNVCVFTACIIHFWSWFLWRRRVGSWFWADRLLYICKYALFKEYWLFFRHWNLSSWESGQDTWLWHEGIHGITICTLSCPKSSQNRWSSTYGCFMAHRTQFSFCKLGIFYFFSFKNGKKPLCCGGVWFVLFFPWEKPG